MSCAEGGGPAATNTAWGRGIKERQGFVKHFKPEALGKQARDTLEMECLPHRWRQAVRGSLVADCDEPSTHDPSRIHSSPIPLLARLGSGPYVKKNSGFQPSADGVT